MNLKTKISCFGVFLVSMMLTAVGQASANCELLKKETVELTQAASDIAEVQKALFNPTSTGLKSSEGKRMYADLVTTTYNKEQSIQGRLKFLNHQLALEGCAK